MDKAADRLKEAAGSLTGDKKDEGHTHVRAEGRDDRFTEVEEAYKGYADCDRNYEKIGKVDDLFVDEDDQPEYIGVKMGFLLEQKTTLIPMGIVRINDRRKLIEVAADKDTNQEAPPFDNNKDITPEYEDRVHGYFGLERASSLPERGRYDDYYTSVLTGDRYADESLAGVDTEYGERAHSQRGTPAWASETARVVTWSSPLLRGMKLQSRGAMSLAPAKRREWKGPHRTTQRSRKLQA